MVQDAEKEYNMEFKDFFSTLKNRISNGYDVPEFFRDLFAMITDVPEENWGIKLDPVNEEKLIMKRSRIKCTPSTKD